MLYRYCDLILQSDTPLPELPLAAITRADIEFHLLPAAEIDPMPVEWFHHHEAANGKVWLTLARQEQGYLLRYTVFADFIIPYDGTRVHCQPRPGVPAETIRHLLLDQVMPLVVSRRGGPVLHASAVAGPEGAIGFIGDTGLGKSTLAASLTKRGLRLITDDCLVLREQDGGFVALPTYPGLRVHKRSLDALLGTGLALPEVAHYTDKKRLGPDNTNLGFTHQPALLRRLYFLGAASPDSRNSESCVEFSRMPQGRALVELIRTSLRLDCQDHKRLQLEFENCEHLIRSIQLEKLTFPRNFDLLPDVCEAILSV
jgi:hypothetical protein